MNKKFALTAAAAVIVLVVFIIFGIGKGCGMHLKKGKLVSLANLANKANELEAKGELMGARDVYQGLINDFPAAAEVDDWQRKSEELNIKLLLSPVITPKSVLYEIKPGDTLIKIAREYKTTVELLMRSNNLTSDRIIPARKIKVWTAPFSIVVDKSQNILILKSEEEVFKTYIVSTGVNNCTPIGTFKIVNKLKNPTWFKAGAVVPAGSPENILGSRWLGFDLAGYGIHGTSDPASLGKQVTQGCVRLANPDVEELYAIVPEGTEVTVVD